jgi:hypothetical protein
MPDRHASTSAGYFSLTPCPNPSLRHSRPLIEAHASLGAQDQLPLRTGLPARAPPTRPEHLPVIHPPLVSFSRPECHLEVHWVTPMVLARPNGPRHPRTRACLISDDFSAVGHRPKLTGAVNHPSGT